MDIMTTEQAGKQWGVTSRRVSELCRSGRIAGTKKPQDARVTDGKWIGYKRNGVEK